MKLISVAAIFIMSINNLLASFVSLSLSPPLSLYVALSPSLALSLSHSLSLSLSLYIYIPCVLQTKYTILKWLPNKEYMILGEKCNLQWNHKRLFFKNHRNCSPPGLRVCHGQKLVWCYIACHWNWMKSYWMFWIGGLRGGSQWEVSVNFEKLPFAILLHFSPCLTKASLWIFRCAS